MAAEGNAPVARQSLVKNSVPKRELGNEKEKHHRAVKSVQADANPGVTVVDLKE